MQRSEQIGDLVAALAKAQAQFKPVGKDKTAKIASQKGSFSYSYADLATVIEATRAALAANGVSVMQPVRLGEGQIVVTTILGHASGQWLSEEMAWPVANADNRSIGSGVTYARRHSYLAMVGAAATDEDDDAESARGGDHETQRPQYRPRPTPEQALAHTPAPRQQQQQPDQPEMTESEKARAFTLAARDRQIFEEAVKGGIRQADFHAWAETVLAHPYSKNTDWSEQDRGILEAEIRTRKDLGGGARA